MIRAVATRAAARAVGRVGLLACLLVVAATPAAAADPIDDLPEAAPTTHRYTLVRALYATGTPWTPEAVDYQFGFADAVIAQCGFRIGRYELLVLDGRSLPEAVAPDATERALLADVLGAEERPLVFFVDALPDVAGDFIAYPRAQASHPTLADTIWIAATADDLAVSLLARGLVSLACNCTDIDGPRTPPAWSEAAAPGNLLARPGGPVPVTNRLAAIQCHDLRDPARSGGLLQSVTGP